MKAPMKVFIKVQRSLGTFSTVPIYNDGYNILILFDTTTNFLFTTSEATFDY